MATSSRGNRAKTQVLQECDMSTLIEPEDPSDGKAMFTASKVVATIGPSSQSVDVLCKMLEAGMTCARLDLTWGTMDYHRQTLDNVAEASRRTRKLCAVMLDTLGREIVVRRNATIGPDGWPVHEETMKVVSGQKLVLTTKDQQSAAKDALPVSYERLPSMVEVGDEIFLGRYLVTGAEEASLFLEVTETTATDVICEARNDAVLGGLLTVFHTERSTSGVTNVQNELPVLHDLDKEALKALSADYEIDFLSLSFCRMADDVLEARSFLKSIGLTNTKVLAKLESRQALYAFKDIAYASDGVIMSRGNLGLDVVPEKMALVQKAMVANCNIMGKPIIITRLVDTMSSNPRPTRAEATDVANAVMDGADAFLLGAETLRGFHPVLTIATILSIARQAEAVFDHTHHFDHLMTEALIADKGEEGIEHSQSQSSMHSDSLPAGSVPPGALPASSPSAGTLRHVGSGAQFGSMGNVLRQNIAPLLSRQESIASSAVRAADKVQASLIIVYTQTGHTASLVSKYRPPMPILTLVVPQLKSNGLSWRLTGRSTARQCLVERGLLPVLAAPSPSVTGETLLEEAIQMTAKWGLVKAHDHIVCVQQIHDSFVIKVVSVDDMGSGIANIRPQSLANLMKVGSDGKTDPQELKDTLSRLPSKTLPDQQPPGQLTNVNAVDAAKANGE